MLVDYLYNYKFIHVRLEITCFTIQSNHYRVEPSTLVIEFTDRHAKISITVASIQRSEEGLYQPRMKLLDSASGHKNLLALKPLLDLRVFSEGLYITVHVKTSHCWES